VSKRTSKRETQRRALPYAAAVRLALPCTRCRVAPGVPCRNYKGQAKAPCPTRGLDVPPPAPPAADPPPALSAGPMRQALLYEYLDPAEGDRPK
jgi:hypothetical protein